nr:GntR family transcriptional regulator [uncultured Cohaesibacter sp.]
MSQRILARELPEGEHLRTQALADDFGVSRSPVSEALKMLSDAGVVEKRPNRGYYVSTTPDSTAKTIPLTLKQDRQSSYQKIADDWRNNILQEDVTEQLLRDRYALTKTQVHDILLRAVRDGWAERKPGYGWRFLEVAKSPESFKQIYQLRMAIEPAAILLPEFEVVQFKLDEMRAAQERMLERDIDQLPVEELLSAGVTFHEELIRFSNNCYFYMTLVRLNQMRRLLEYRAVPTQERFIEQCRQHLTIIDLLDRGETLEAAYTVKKHLNNALQIKSELMWALDNETGQDL